MQDSIAIFAETVIGNMLVADGKFIGLKPSLQKFQEIMHRVEILAYLRPDSST